ncbi:uncharacterized protein A4U43_C08F5730 [Asparagus officinalis]|nr:uncharacterized protein A4U43_C08F5730 [Asparagus officinalis]
MEKLRNGSFIIYACYITEPWAQYYICLVDFYGGAGRLSTVCNVIKATPIKLRSGACRALLNACKICKNIEYLGKLATKKITELKSRNHGYSVLDIKGEVHEFSVGHQSHPRYKKIKDMFGETSRRLRLAGYSAKINEVSQQLGWSSDIAVMGATDGEGLWALQSGRSSGVAAVGAVDGEWSGGAAAVGAEDGVVAVSVVDGEGPMVSLPWALQLGH